MAASELHCVRVLLATNPTKLFFDPIFDFLMQNPKDVDGNNAIRELLESQKLQENSEDDKSLVVAELAR